MNEDILDGELLDILKELPRSDESYMYGFGKQPNAFIYVDEDRLCILPVGGGFLSAHKYVLGADIAPFSD